MTLAAVILLVVYAPWDWGRVGRDAAYLVAGLRQPENTAQLREDHLFDRAQTVTPPAALAEGDWPENREDTTRLDLPAEIPVASPAITVTSPPGQKKGGGIVLEKTLTGKEKDGITTVNRSGKAEDIAAALAGELTQTFTQTDDPQVLILHTHTTEGYMTYDAGYYNPGDRDRTRDHTKNVCAVGEAIRLALEQRGIVAIHDTTVHDSPQYTGAYTRSATTAQGILEQYPSIRVVLDVHRDAVMEGDAVVKPTATVAGKKAAQMMLITGTVTTDALPHPHWQENLTLSARLQQALEQKYRGLMRPLNTVASRYNQHLSPGWVLVEVGAEGNTVEEAVYAGQLLADTLADLLTA